MKKKAAFVAILASLALGAAGVSAQEDVIDKTIDACKVEIEKYCSQVTPGEGRLLACFYAHGDKLSGRCEYALYTAAAELEQFVAAVTHLATQCLDDLEKHCAEVEMGEGRVASCLLEHKKEVTEGCRKAIDDTGLEVADD